MDTPAPATRDFNSGYIISLSSNAYVNYSIAIACTLSLSGGEVGTVYLEYADDDSFTTNLTEVCRVVHGNTGTLTIGLNSVQSVTAQLCGFIAPEKRVRIRTQANSGTPDFTYISGQEITGF